MFMPVQVWSPQDAISPRVGGLDFCETLVLFSLLQNMQKESTEKLWTQRNLKIIDSIIFSDDWS